MYASGWKLGLDLAVWKLKGATWDVKRNDVVQDSFLGTSLPFTNDALHFDSVYFQTRMSYGR